MSALLERSDIDAQVNRRLRKALPTAARWTFILYVADKIPPALSRKMILEPAEAVLPHRPAC
jgi:hypothetical protein